MKTDRRWDLEVNEIRALGIAGKTLCEIGLVFGVSGQYIRKLIKKYKIFADGVPYGVKARTAARLHNRFLEFGIKEDTDLYRAKRTKFTRKKCFAKRNGIEFNIRFGEIQFPEYCPVLNIQLDYFAQGIPRYNSPSFDRIDNSLGYVTGNVRIISNRANTLKNSASVEEIEAILNYMRNAAAQM